MEGEDAYFRDIFCLGNEVLEEVLVPEEALIKALPKRSRIRTLQGSRTLDAVADVMVVREVENCSKQGEVRTRQNVRNKEVCSHSKDSMAFNMFTYTTSSAICSERSRG